MLQTDILSKSNQLKSLEDVVKHAQSYDAALYDQSKLSENPELNHFKSDYKRQQNQQK